MRKCPKCGTGYADTDFRTICGACMVDLVPVADDAPLASEVQSGPVALDVLAPAPAPIITVTIPTVEVAIPEISPPHMPNIPGLPEGEPAEPEPGPIPSPVTPQPNPNPAVPPLIPLPQPTPVPVPVPPAPAQPAANDTVGRRIVTLEDSQRSRASTTLYTFWSVICGGGTVFLFLPLWLRGDAGFFGFLLSAGGTIATVACIRHAIYTQTISNATVTTVTPPRLGGPLLLRVAIGSLRNIEVTAAEVVVEAQETAVRGSGKSRSTYRHTAFSRQIALPLPRQWKANEELSTTVEIPIPANAPTTFIGSSNRIEWQIRLNGVIPGWYPDIRVKTDLAMLPILVGQPPLTPREYRYSLPELCDLHGEVQLLCGQEAGVRRPIFAAGSRVPFTLSINPVAGAPNQKIWMELGYQVDGSGNDEKHTVVRVACFPGGWEPDMPQTVAGVLEIPLDIPITYLGTHVSVDWQLTVRHEIPWKTDKRQIIPVLLVPKAEG